MENTRKFSDFAEPMQFMKGEKIKIAKVEDVEIEVKGYKVGDSQYDDKEMLTLQIELDGEDRIIFSGSKVLIEQCQKYEDMIPFTTTISKINDKFYSFT